MSFKKGDKVQLNNEEEAGYVLKLQGQNVTWRTSMGETRVDASTDLKVNEGMGAYFSSETPDLIEVAENVAAYGVIQAMTKNKILGMGTMEFLGEDLVYEVLLKGYVSDVGFFNPLTEKYPLTQKQFDSWMPSMPQLMNAANKTWVITLIDTVYRLVRSRSQFSKERLYYILKVFGAMEIGNYGHNLWATRTQDLYSPQ